jgi:threonyl-tRNA synthetase
VRVITLNDDEALINYAQPIVAELRTNMVLVDADYSATPFKAKISNAERSTCFPPPHVVGYGSSSVVATWKPAQ